MAHKKLCRITITYGDDTTEEYVIHSDETLEWVVQQKVKTLTAFTTLLTSNSQIVHWFSQHGAKKIIIKQENED